jgi:LmbE family N-acetylglucosaminyl deacetylase
MLPAVNDLGDILGVWAHPDDECYLSGGIMTCAVRSGHEVTVAMATRGEIGTPDPERWPPERLGVFRERELRDSLAVFGVTDLRLLDYIDGTCAAVDPAEATAKIAAIMREVQPDTVLTFGPEGMTGHPDHIAVSDWTTAAFGECAKPGARLLYATVTPQWADAHVRKLQEFDVYAPGTPAVTASQDLALDFSLDDELRAVKREAIKRHASQIEGMLEAFGWDFFDSATRQEFYRLGAVAG